MKNKEKVKVKKVKQKQCRGYHCNTMLPYGDKHILCENCRGKYADGLITGLKTCGCIALTATTVVVPLITNGKINIKKK